MPVPWTRTAATYLLLALIGTLGAVSDATLNQWAKTSRASWLVLSYLLWIAVATLLGLMLRSGHFNFGSAVAVFLLANTAGAVLLDYRFFGNRPGRWEWAGMACAALAMCLMEMGRGARTP